MITDTAGVEVAKGRTDVNVGEAVAASLGIPVGSLLKIMNLPEVFQVCPTKI